METHLENASSKIFNELNKILSLTLVQIFIDAIATLTMIYLSFFITLTKIIEFKGFLSFKSYTLKRSVALKLIDISQPKDHQPSEYPQKTNRRQTEGQQKTNR